MYLVFFLVCFIACFIGSITGLSGGVIIKPTIDSFGVMPVSEISFLSGLTALTMSIVSLIRSRSNKNVDLDIKIALFLGIGGAIGGTFGKQIFEVIKQLFQNDNKVGLTQSVILFIMNVFIYIYMKNKHKVKSYKIQNFFVCILTGIFLGIMSSFLGIGGGPLNVALIYILFSMAPKQATLCSLVIVFFSQSASFITTLVRGVPTFDRIALVVMCIGAVSGALIGSSFGKKLNNEKTSSFFTKVLIFLILLNIYNIVKFSLAI